MLYSSKPEGKGSLQSASYTLTSGQAVGAGKTAAVEQREKTAPCQMQLAYRAYDFQGYI